MSDDTEAPQPKQSLKGSPFPESFFPDVASQGDKSADIFFDELKVFVPPSAAEIPVAQNRPDQSGDDGIGEIPLKPASDKGLAQGGEARAEPSPPRAQSRCANFEPQNASSSAPQASGCPIPHSHSVGARPEHSFGGAEDERPTTMHYVDEYERATASLLWHHPELLPLLQHELHLESHVANPIYRKVIEAIALVYGEIGEADWPCVLHAIREMGAFEECGGLEGLNAIFTNDSRYAEGRREPELFLRDYIRVLKEYALARKTDPYATVRRYTSGYGFLQRNKLATRPQHPSSIGQVRCPHCGRTAKVAGWEAGEGKLNLKLEPEREPRIK